MNQPCKHALHPKVAVHYIARLLAVSCIATFIWKGGLSPELTELVVFVLAACAHAQVCFLMYIAVPCLAQTFGVFWVTWYKGCAF